MNKIDQFYAVIEKSMTLILATGTDAGVTMRTVSPVLCRNSVLIFTSEKSKKYQQLRQNPHCCLSAGPFFAEAAAEFLGATMLPENQEYRTVYSRKFPQAFDEGVEFGGRDAEFILFKPTRLTGWAFENDLPTENGIPTIPFDIEIQ